MVYAELMAEPTQDPYWPSLKVALEPVSIEHSSKGCNKSGLCIYWIAFYTKRGGGGVRGMFFFKKKNK